MLTFAEFKEKSPLLAKAFTDAIEVACEQLDYNDLQCIDWLSYNPDFFIEQKNKKAA